MPAGQPVENQEKWEKLKKKISFFFRDLTTAHRKIGHFLI
jgi:hypothetical protein